MAAEILELDTSHHGMCLCLRCTVDNKSYSQNVLSSEFRFQSGGWKLEYHKSGTQYFVYLWKCSGVISIPLHVSVHLESSKYGRIVSVLRQERRFTTNFEKKIYWCTIWGKEQEEILRSVPEFRQHGVLNFVVILKLELEGLKHVATQTEDVGETHLVPTTASTLVPTTASTLVRNAASTVASAVGESIQTASTSIELLNTSDCLASLSKDFSKMLDQGTDTDVEFQCGAHTTRAHGAVVSARSDVIASMLSSDMVEGATRVVKIPNMEHEVFKHFLRYIYTGQLPVLTVELALDLYESGDQYAVLGLAKRCSQYLLKHLSVQNSHHILVVADAHANAELKQAAIDFMVVNRVPRVSDHWKDFCKAHPMLAIEVLDRSCP